MRVFYLCVLCESYLCRIIKATHTLCKVNHAHCACDAHARVHAAACILTLLALALLAMALLKYLNQSLPTAKDTGIGKVATKETNRAVNSDVQKPLRRCRCGKEKHTVFSPANSELRSGNTMNRGNRVLSHTEPV